MLENHVTIHLMMTNILKAENENLKSQNIQVEQVEQVELLFFLELTSFKLLVSEYDLRNKSKITKDKERLFISICFQDSLDRRFKILRI